MKGELVHKEEENLLKIEHYVKIKTIESKNFRQKRDREKKLKALLPKVNNISLKSSIGLGAEIAQKTHILQTNKQKTSTNIAGNRKKDGKM